MRLARRVDNRLYDWLPGIRRYSYQQVVIAVASDGL
jgi:hypothetical protein